MGSYRSIDRLYDRLIVPPAVMDELVTGQFETKDAYLRHLEAEDPVFVKTWCPQSFISTHFRATRDLQCQTKTAPEIVVSGR